MEITGFISNCPLFPRTCWVKGATAVVVVYLNESIDLFCFGRGRNPVILEVYCVEGERGLVKSVFHDELFS